MTRKKEIGPMIVIMKVFMAAGLCSCLSLRAQTPSGSSVTLPPVEVTANAPLVKVADYQMREARWQPAAVAQGDFIYIIGGSDSRGAKLTSVERFNVRTGKSEPFAQLQTGRSGHRAVLLGNRIYVIGGLVEEPVGWGVVGGPDQSMNVKNQGLPTPTEADDADYAIRERFKALDLLGDEAEGVPGVKMELSPTVEVIDPATRTVSRAADMPEARAGFACVLRDGKIYVMGGLRPYKRSGLKARTNAVLMLDLASGRWTDGVSMPTPREAVGALIDGGLIVVPGGYDGHMDRNEVEVFNPSDGLWRTLPPLHRRVGAQSLVFLEHYLFLFGAYDAPGELIAYDLVNRKSESFTLQYKSARHTAAVTLDGKIYVIGGLALRGGAALDYIQVYALRKKT